MKCNNCSEELRVVPRGHDLFSFYHEDKEVTMGIKLPIGDLLSMDDPRLARLVSHAMHKAIGGHPCLNH